jgi:hypothetical protein
MSHITVISRTQKIIVNPEGASVSVINAGPIGPASPIPENIFQVVIHGSDANVIRPNADAVYWIGTVEPINALDHDLWGGYI